MHITKQSLISALLGLLLLGSPALAGDNVNLLGFWKLASFHTEDVQTKVRNNVYGEQPMGYLRVWDNGHFSAYAVHERFDATQEYSLYGAIYYSGRYRVEGGKFIMQVDNVHHEGWVGTQAFDLSWNEARTLGEEVRYFYLENGRLDRDFLRIETAPMPNPNGAGNTIIGRLVWERDSEAE